MKSLKSYVLECELDRFLGIESTYINEGGQAGHMAHPFDYTDFTGNDLLELVDSLEKLSI